jgi:hypothetical protein
LLKDNLVLSQTFKGIEKLPCISVFFIFRIGFSFFAFGNELLLPRRPINPGLIFAAFFVDGGSEWIKALEKDPRSLKRGVSKLQTMSVRIKNALVALHQKGQRNHQI